MPRYRLQRMAGITVARLIIAHPALRAWNGVLTTVEPKGWRAPRNVLIERVLNRRGFIRLEKAWEQGEQRGTVVFTRDAFTGNPLPVRFARPGGQDQPWLQSSKATSPLPQASAAPMRAPTITSLT